MTTRYLGSVLKARPALLRWQDSPFTRAAIAVRWVAWLANGWRPTTAATLTLLLAVGVTAPWLVAVSAAAAVWGTVGDRAKITARLVAVGSLAAAMWWTWSSAGALLQLVVVGLVGVWPVDALVGLYDPRVRVRRWWCELRRGFPVRYAIMAAKAMRIQGMVGGERQLIEGRRPILDHPAISHRVRFDGPTAWALCSVPPGRNAEAFQDVLAELAASFVNVQRMDLVFTDDYQTYGYLAVTFGPPLLNTSAAPAPPPSRIGDFVHTAAPHIGVAAVLAAAIWTGLT